MSSVHVRAAFNPPCRCAQKAAEGPDEATDAGFGGPVRPATRLVHELQDLPERIQFQRLLARHPALLGEAVTHSLSHSRGALQWTSIVIVTMAGPDRVTGSATLSSMSDAVAFEASMGHFCRVALQDVTGDTGMNQGLAAIFRANRRAAPMGALACRGRFSVNPSSLIERAALIMSRFAQVRGRALDFLCGHRVVFHHMAKSGGTSVYRALRLRYAFSYANLELQSIYSTLEALHPDFSPDEIRDESVRFRERQLIYYMHNDVRCISGHVAFSDAAFDLFNEKFRFITTLRDPIALFISTFFYNSTSPQDRWKIDVPIEEFLESPRARIFGEVYARFYSGTPTSMHESSANLLGRAKENLEKFSAVGLTEDMPRFERRLRDILGVRVRIGHENQSRVSDTERQRTITPEIRRKIEDLSAPNIEIYDFVKRQLAS